MATPQARSPVPRNSKLSAYYTRLKAASPSSPRTPQSTAAASVPQSRIERSTSKDLPILGGRQAAIDYANHLAQTLALPDLMTRSSALRADADRLSTSLHASSRQYFAQLSSAAAAAKTTMTVAHRLGARARPETNIRPPSNSHEDLPPMPVSPTAPVVVAAVATTAAQCAAIGSRLSATRQRIDALHGIQKLTHLLSATKLLTDTLPALIDNATSQLCTDATEARHAAFVAARRTSIVLPAVRALSSHSSSFLTAFEQLEYVTATVSNTIRERVFSPGDAATSIDDIPQALTLVDAAQLLLLFGASAADLQEDFLRACSRYVCAPKPTNAAEETVASAGPLAKAHLQVSFAAAEMVPRLYETADWFSTAFLNENTANTETSLDDFTVWASNVADEFITGRVRKVCTSDILGAPSDAALLDKALTALPDTKGTGIKARIYAVLSAVVDGLRDTINNIAETQAKQIITKSVQSVLDGSYADTSDGPDRATKDVMEAVHKVSDAGSKLAPLLSGVEQWQQDNIFIDIVAGHATKQANGGDVKVIARAGMLCQRLAEKVGMDRAKVALQTTGDQLSENVEQTIVKRASNALNVRVDAASKGDTSEETAIEQAAEMLAEADHIGKECGMPTLCKGAIVDLTGLTDSSLFLDEGHLGRLVVQAWVEQIRAITIPTAAGVHMLQRDAAFLSASVGFDAAPKIANAAVDRCDDASVEILDETELAQARAANKH